MQHELVKVPFSKSSLALIKILKDEGFIKYYEVQTDKSNRSGVKIGLKYDPSGNPVISSIRRISKPGCRVYVKKSDIPKVLNGFGMCFVSTSQGVISGKEARIRNIGGELLGDVY